MSILNGSEEAALFSKLYRFWTSLTVPYSSTNVSVAWNLQSPQDFKAILTQIFHSCVIVLTTGQDGPTWHNGPVRTDVITETYSSPSFHPLILLLICLLPHKAASFSTRPHSAPPHSQKCDSPFTRPLICTGHNSNTVDTQTNMHAPGRIRTHYLDSQAVKTGRFRPRCHCDWYVFHFLLPYFIRGFTFHLEP